jgi:hypothetical protein
MGLPENGHKKCNLKRPFGHFFVFIPRKFLISSTTQHSHKSINTIMKKEREQSILSNTLLALQVAFCAFFISSTTYDTTQDVFHFNQYIIFRDIMAMLLLGFGYLMTFLKSYGLGAVGFTMLLTVLAMQLNVGMEYGMRAALARATQNESSTPLEWPLQVTMMNLIDAEFAAATLLISFGVLIGRASPLQMIVLTLSQAFFYVRDVMLAWSGRNDPTCLVPV